MTPQQLKNSILQLAIQGKLVKQISEEGTGEELFKIIQEEKKELIKKGNIRKQKSLPQIKSDEVPFSIPNTWKWIRLGDVGDWGAGGTPLRTNPNYYGGDIPWLKTGDLTDGEVRAVSEYITDLALEKTSIRLNPTGSVLMAMYGATIGKLGILTRPMTTNQACCACIVYPNIFNKYLFYFLLASRNYFIKRGEGGAQPNISRAKIIETCMPLPPFKEQKRIVKKIEEILPLVNCYGNAWKKLKELNKKFPTDIQNSILQEAIQGKLCEQKDEDGSAQELIEKILLEKERLIESGQIKKQKALPPIQDDEIPFDIPQNWAWSRFGELGEYKKGPFGSALTKSIFVPKSEYSIKVYEQKNAIKKDAMLGEYYITNQYYNEKMSTFTVLPGDIIVSCAGTIGETFVMPENIEKGIINQALMRMRLFKPILVDYFLMYFDFALKQSARKNSKGSAIKNIPPFDILKRYLVPLPPLVEQKRIVNKLNKLSAIVERYDKKINKT